MRSRRRDVSWRLCEVAASRHLAELRRSFHAKEASILVAAASVATAAALRNRFAADRPFVHGVHVGGRRTVQIRSRHGGMRELSPVVYCNVRAPKRKRGYGREQTEEGEKAIHDDGPL